MKSVIITHIQWENGQAAKSVNHMQTNEVISHNIPNIISLVSSSYYNSSSVCLFVCSPTPPRSFDGSSPNLVGVCRWTSELPLRGSFFKRSTGHGSTGQTSLFWSRRHQAETTPLQKTHGVFCRARRLLPSKRHTASKSLIPSTGIFTSIPEICHLLESEDRLPREFGLWPISLLCVTTYKGGFIRVWVPCVSVKLPSTSDKSHSVANSHDDAILSITNLQLPNVPQPWMC